MTSPGLQHDSAPETTSSAPSPAQRGGLETALKPRHITMISIAGVIGAGLFVGSATAIAAAGPAVLISYALAGALVVLVMRMLGEMAIGPARHRLVLDLRRSGAGPLGGLLDRLALLVVLGDRDPGRGHRRRADPRRLVPAVPQWAFALHRHRAAHGHQPAQRRQLRRVRVLVRPGQGRRDRGASSAWACSPSSACCRARTRPASGTCGRTAGSCPTVRGAVLAGHADRRCSPSWAPRS